jgi:hypothetical protein
MLIYMCKPLIIHTLAEILRLAEYGILQAIYRFLSIDLHPSGHEKNI